jgi:diadenosine tetraphosphate (Ap4A) HIT family hydrolase
MPGRECLICSMEEVDPASRIFLDELWAAEVAPGFEVPGWFFLRARRHAEKLTGLDESETATFGRHAHDLVSAVEQVTGAPGHSIDHHLMGAALDLMQLGFAQECLALRGQAASVA